MRGAGRAWLATSTGLAGLMAASASYADTPTAPTAVDAQAAAQVGEILVTAQKRSESVQAVPAAISAISGAELEKRGIATVEDLQFAVPSFHSGTLTGSTNVTIRGVGATTVGTSGTAGVAVNVDGVYQPQTSTIDLAQVDLARVEVLRGP